MEENGIIEKSESEWASPLVVVTKKDEDCDCVDYRRLNQVTSLMHTPCPGLRKCWTRLIMLYRDNIKGM